MAVLRLLISDMRFASRAAARAECNEVNTTDDNNPMMDMTTRSSMSVKPRVLVTVFLQ